MQKVALRDDIAPLTIRSNGCTNPIKIHPIKNTLFLFTRFGLKDGDYLPINDKRITMIKFDGRQWWTCYYYDVDSHGWACERGNVFVRLSEKDFITLFGKITVVGNGREIYHEECENA